MEYRKLGSTGLEVSELCLGTMTFGWGADKEMSYAIMDKALEAGINFFDTADIYSRWAEGNPGGVAEQWIGDWLSDRKPTDINRQFQGCPRQLFSAPFLIGPGSFRPACASLA